METNEIFWKELSNSIVKVLDNNRKEITYKKLYLKPHLFKYSSIHKEKLTLFLDDIPISSKNKYKIVYRCSCGNINEILLEKFVLKNRLCCKSCRETEEKRKWHGEVIRRLHRGETYTPRRNKCNKRSYDFHSETEEYKNDFYRNNLTESEFEKCIKYIYSINDIEIEGKNVIFLEHENGVNGKKYRQMVNIDGIKTPFKNIKLKCPLCGEIFSISRPIKDRVLKNNFDCKGCFLNNKTFSIKKYRDGLTYQSNEELDFIKRCDNNKIKIEDGQILTYKFKGKTHRYKTDFFLPELKEVIEIKDNHIWHRKQIESGKWQAKENAAKVFCEENGYSYILLFPNDIDNYFLTYEKDSLTFTEMVKKLG